MCPSPSRSSIEKSPKSKSQGAKRGRPKTETLPEKIREGEEQEGDHQCSVCKRLFPRRKSLNAHERTHTNERPYYCDYPSCNRAFRQSGQLKTHQRRHTREKPFVCPVEECQQRFLHSNRSCPKHPNETLKRDGNGEICQGTESMSFEELVWLERHRAEKENPTKRRRIDPGSNLDTKKENPAKRRRIDPGSNLDTKKENPAKRRTDSGSNLDKKKELVKKIKLLRKAIKEAKLLKEIESTRGNLNSSEIISVYVLLTMEEIHYCRKNAKLI